MFGGHMDYKVSILIPTKNRKLLLERALVSICSQSIFPDEIVVINDGSQDETKSFLDFFSRGNSKLNWIIINREKSGGVNVARNQGIASSKADWVLFLDDDDELLPGSLGIVGEKLSQMPSNFNVAYFNSLILKNGDSINGGFQFQNLENDIDFYDPSYEETLTKFNLKGDCKPVFRRSLFKENRYLFPETVNGFESYTMNLIAKDNMGIRYHKDITTLIHQEDELKDRLSINAPAKNPWPLFVLHFKQIFQHFYIYIKNPFFFFRKLIEMFKLFVRSFIFSQKRSIQK